MIGAQNVHDSVPVHAIEFNPNMPNLLASGGKEVVIQEFSKSITNPTSFSPGEPNHHEG